MDACDRRRPGIKQIPFIQTSLAWKCSSPNITISFSLSSAGILFVTGRVLRSRVGRSWLAIREDQVAAKSLGVETSKCKCMNFMYGAFWAGIIGAAYAPFVNYIESSQFTTDTGFNVLAMVVIGGQGTL